MLAPTPDSTLAAPAAPAAVTPATALTTAMHLAEMQPPALANTIRLLDQAERKLEEMSGICGILRGLALKRAKEVIGHGNFMDWVLKETGKKDRIARYEMQVADGFLESLQKTAKGKTATRCQFEDAEQMLLEDFAAGMAEIGKAPLDENNPVVAAVAGYVQGRTMRAMIDALPISRRGGKMYERDGVKGQRKPAAEAQAEAALDLWTPIIFGLRLEGLDHQSFVHLPDTGPVSRETLRGLLTDVTAAMRAAERQPTAR